MANDRCRRILVIAGCSGEGRLTTPKPDGAEVKFSIGVNRGEPVLGNLDEASCCAVDQLRARLVEMRAQLIGRLCSRLDGGDLALLGSVGAALAALDHDV